MAIVAAGKRTTETEMGERKVEMESREKAALSVLSHTPKLVYFHNKKMPPAAIAENRNKYLLGLPRSLPCCCTFTHNTESTTWKT